MLELPVITQVVIWIKAVAVLCGLAALPLLIGTRRRFRLDRNDVAAIVLIAFGFLLHGAAETLLRCSPHGTFNGYVLGFTGGPDENRSSLYLDDLGFPPKDESAFPEVPSKNLFVARAPRNVIPASFWTSNGDLFTKCEYRRWDHQITRIDAIPIPGSKGLLAAWHWRSRAEGIFLPLFETILAVLVLCSCVSLLRTNPKPESTDAARKFPNSWALGIYVAAVALFVSWVFFVRVSDRIFQYRAEVLLQKIQKLELRKSAWEEAQALQREYRSNTRQGGPCTEVHCALNIELDHWYPLTLPEGNLYPPILRAMSFVGGRWAQTRATVHIRNGVVWGKSFHIVVPHRKGYALIADAGTVRSFPSRNNFLESPPGNVAYGRPGGCEICDALWAQVTPFASASDVRDAFDFDLSCIGGTLRACTSAGSLLPTAARHVYPAQDVATVENLRIEPPPWAIDHLPWTPDMLRQIGRDACHAGIVEVIASRPENPSNPHDQAVLIRFKVLEALKDNAIRGEKRWYDCSGAGIRKQTEARFVPNRFSIATPTNGTHFIGFWIADEDIRLLLPVSEENLTAVKEGINEDSIDIE